MQRACVGAELCMYKEQKESPLRGRNEVSEGELGDEVRNRGGINHAGLELQAMGSGVGLRAAGSFGGVVSKQGSSRIWLPLLKDHVWLNGPREVRLGAGLLEQFR